MNINKMLIITIGIIAIGIFTLPTTISLFSGQHSWYNLNAAGNQVPCDKCHADIRDEMISNKGAHQNFSCSLCHRTGNITYASGDGTVSIPGKEAHAAGTIECLDCHGSDTFNHTNPEIANSCIDCHPQGTTINIAAGGFGITNCPNDTGTKAAHKKFVFDAMNNSLMEGANEACIACHTEVGVNITWTKNEYMVFNANENSQGIWTVDNFAAGGKNTTYVNSTNGV